MSKRDLIPPGEQVDIAAYRSKPGQVTRSPFGDIDEIGMLNLMTPSSRAAILSPADPRMVYDLSVEYFVGMPVATYNGDPPYQIWMSHTPRGTVIDDANGSGRERNGFATYSGDCISLYTHCGTHFDLFPHFGYNGQIWNGFNDIDHLGSRHWTKAGADKMPAVIARGVLIDVATYKGVDVLPSSYGIGPADIIGALRKQKTNLQKGDVALVRTGRMSLWAMGSAAYIDDEPGLNREGAEYLAESGVMIVGSDNAGVEQKPSEDSSNPVPVHTYLLAEAGIPLLEVANLEELARDEIYEFLFIACGLKLRGATASPVRPIAIPTHQGRPL